jgi:hypothetical protein
LAGHEVKAGQQPLDQPGIGPTMLFKYRPPEAVLHLHYRYRFDPLGLDETDRRALHEQTRASLESLSKTERTAVEAGK